MSSLLPIHPFMRDVVGFSIFGSFPSEIRSKPLTGEAVSGIFAR